MSDWTKSKKELNNKEIEKMSASPSKFLGGILGNINSRSAYSQIFIGAVSGWVTGYATGKVGKLVVLIAGGSIILLEIAHNEGLLKIDWSKVSKNIDRVTDKVEDTVSGHERSWVDKAERFVDRKLDRAEETFKNKMRKGRRWYSNLIGDENGARLNDLHLFLIAFAGGVAIGLGTA